MDDLAGLDWNASSSSSSGAKKPPSAPPGSNYFPSLRPPQQQATPPLSGRSTPASAGRTTASGANSKPSTPAQSNNVTSATASKDSFANLFTSTSTSASNKSNLSLAEQQRRLQQQKVQQQTSGPIGGSSISEDAWASLGGSRGRQVGGGDGFGGSGGTTKSPTSTAGTSFIEIAGHQAAGPHIQAPVATRPKPTFGKSTESEADVLAAFNKEAPVDRSSHFPPPGIGQFSKTGTPASTQSGFGGPGGGLLGDDDGGDDDPFGLGTSAPRSSGAVPTGPVASLDDDDILGDLGKPVSQLPPRPATRSPAPIASRPPVNDPNDKAVAELVDMGFPADKASRALEATDGNVQAAVSWLLTRAHEESRSKTQTPVEDGRRPPQNLQDGSRSSSTQRRATPGSQTREERESAQKASEFGTSLWKGANALWKQGKKQLDKAVADFNADQDSSQPKWMREANSSNRSPSGSRPESDAAPGVTDEAMMLDSHDKPRSRPRRQDTSSPGGSARASRDQSPALPVRPAPNQTGSAAKPAWQQSAVPSARSKLSRQMVEEQEAQAYVSPARRKKANAQPIPEGDLLDNRSAPAPRTVTPASAASQKIQTNNRASPITVRPPAKTRPVPNVSAITMKSCTQHRAAGTAAFKKGDYSAAETSYSSAITALPASHPLIILLLTNRATTRLKTGDTKGALADADQAMDLVGPARGAGESIEVPDEDDDGSSKTTTKDMGPFWGKALMRRAEALEHMERWPDAAASWREAVEGGVGGANAIRARNRCENAARPKSKPAPPPPPKPAASAPNQKRTSSNRPVAGTKPIDLDPRKAVSRLREANAQAEKADEERFRLSDSVDGRIAAWRGGKEGNLRALLGSLDSVLWPDSGWKKVGMGELLAPNKVKIAYMKGIAKVHPDKLPQGASTEQVMISGAVFATLNEAWDRFKAENGL